MTHQQMANAIRALSMDAVEAAQSGHPGMPMGMADVATVLFQRFLKFDAAHPHWPDRDRFILSAGHGSMLLYSLLYLTGYESVTLEKLKNFRQFASGTPGHPEYRHTEGVETTTGPLGQGFSTAVGMAIAERHLAARFGEDLVDHRTFVIASDGDLMEGVSHEAAALAGHLRLGRMIVYWDDNEISIDGPTSLSMSEDVCKRFESYGWHVQVIDGHDAEAIARATEAAIAEDRPSIIACRTVIGFGAPTKAGTAASHGAALGAEEIAGARKALDWPHAPFEIPDDILDAWREAGRRGGGEHKAWSERLGAATADMRQAFDGAVAGTVPAALDEAVDALKRSFAEEKPKLATRQSSQKVLERLTAACAELVGGSADLTGSVGTLPKGLPDLSADDYGGRYIRYGVREHGMAAAMNGMALHRGVIPYAGTFLVFSDYCRPGIRLSALMGVRVIYVMTHDSIGLGEDGPTHQPIEHLPALRAMPRLLVFRPADAVETAECWQAALSEPERPSVMTLSRQGLPALRTTHDSENRCAMGGYILRETDGQPDTVLIATGSEVHVACDAAALLDAEGIKARVVSMPCTRLFDEQSEGYRRSILPPDVPRVAIEAAASFGWERYVGSDGLILGIDSFGESAPAPVLFEHFGFTPDAVARKVRQKLAGRATA